jgi:hypothetical protein
VDVPILQLLMMAVFVRKHRSCEAGWINAGFTRRAATTMWASAFLLRNGSADAKPGRAVITSQDMIPVGLEQAGQSDIARLHEQLGTWLDYWSARYPTDTLEQAMLNLLVRLWKAKDGWAAERRDEPFPFDQAMAAAVAGKFEPYVSGKV